MSDATPTAAETVVPFYGRMTNSAYEAERAILRKTYGDSRQQAGAKFEQALAILFHRSGWTQEELAKKEDKSRQRITQMLLFGRFLNFATTVANSKSLTNALIERSFRKLWERTEGDERIRFREVIKLMSTATPRVRPRPGIADDIKKRYADGKWHALPVMAQKLNADIDMVDETLEPARAKRYGCRVEKKKVGTETHFRLFKLDKTVSSSELTEKLAPIVKGLEEQGRKNQVTMSVTQVAVLAAQLRRLVDEWAG